MGYKHRALDIEAVRGALAEPNDPLKIVPHVDGRPRICELVRYHLEDVRIKGTWSGSAALELWHHALALVAQLPVREVISVAHLHADLTLGLGMVGHDYLTASRNELRRWAVDPREKSPRHLMRASAARMLALPPRRGQSARGIRAFSPQRRCAPDP
jgi:hypothetical protein